MKGNVQVNVAAAEQDTSAELGRIGGLRAVLEGMKPRFPEVGVMVATLMGLVVHWQKAEHEHATERDAREARRNAETMVKMMLGVVDGFRFALAFIDPKFSKKLPIRSKIEVEDPFGFTRDFVETLKTGGHLSKEFARVLEEILAKTESESGRIAKVAEDVTELGKKAKVARLKMREYEKTCEVFIHSHLDKKDELLKHLRVARKPKKEGETKDAKSKKAKGDKKDETKTDSSNSTPADVTQLHPANSDAGNTKVA